MRMGTACCLLCATALTLMLALAQALPAYASQNAQNGQTVQGGPSAKGGRNAQSIQEAGTEEITFSPDESSASADSRVTGHIRVELISVVMPAGGLEFQVDTKIPFQVDNPGAQIQSPGIQIRNLSVVPVKLEISSVPEVGAQDVRFSEKFSDYVDQSFRLVDTISGVGPPGTAILVLGDSSRRYSSSEEFERYAILPGRTGIFVAEIPAEGEAVLKLYGKVAPDFYGAFEFTVRPTLKISTVRANETADSYKK